MRGRSLYQIPARLSRVLNDPGRCYSPRKLLVEGGLRQVSKPTLLKGKSRSKLKLSRCVYRRLDQAEIVWHGQSRDIGHAKLSPVGDVVGRDIEA